MKPTSATSSSPTTRLTRAGARNRSLLCSRRSRSRPGPDKSDLGLYLHIPFCRKRCKFCYFRVYTDRNSKEVQRYLDALAREVELYATQPAVAGRSLHFVYFGGGTPSFISPRQLRGLVGRDAERIFLVGRGRSGVRMRAGNADRGQGAGDPGHRGHPAEPRPREHGRRDPPRERPGSHHQGDPPVHALDPGGGLPAGQRGPHRRHAGRDLASLAPNGAADHRSRSRQHHRLSDGAALQHGVREEGPGRRRRNAALLKLADPARLARLRLRTVRGSRFRAVERLHGKEARPRRALHLP